MMDAQPPLEGAHSDGTTAPPGPSKWLVSASVAVIGIAVIVFLLRYNVSGLSIWYTGQFMTNRSWDEYLLVNVSWLLLPPIIVILGFLREGPEEFGFRSPDPGAW